MGAENIGARSLLSPPTEQEVSVAPNRNFPDSNLSFLRYLLLEKTHIDRFFEGMDATLDTFKGFQEWQELRCSPMRFGEGVPKSEGTVVIAGGFLNSKLNFCDTKRFFEGIGKKVIIYIPGGIVNASPVEFSNPELMDLLESIDGKVDLIGYSKGGLETYDVYATNRAKITAKVNNWFLVCSPRPEWVSSVTGVPYLATQILTGGDDFRYSATILDQVDIENIDGVMVTAIGNPNDPIIRGKMAGQPEDQFEVDTSHSGAMVNIEVLTLIAERMSFLDSINLEAA